MKLSLNSFKKKKLFYCVVLACLVFCLSLSVLPLRKISFNILRQPLSLLTLIRREIQGLLFFHRNMSENERLKKEIGLLKQRLVFLNEILLENERLTSLFSFKQKSSYKVIAARVIARAADSWSSCAIVNKGSLNGVKLDLVAVTHLGLVGRVIEVSKNATKIALLNDPTLSVSAVVQRSRQEGLVCGTLGLHLMMKYLPKDSDIKAGDIITTSGLSHIYPKGLLIGTVVDLGEEFSGLSHYAIIKPAVNLSSLEEVLLIVH